MSLNRGPDDLQDACREETYRPMARISESLAPGTQSLQRVAFLRDATMGNLSACCSPIPPGSSPSAFASQMRLTPADRRIAPSRAVSLLVSACYAANSARFAHCERWYARAPKKHAAAPTTSKTAATTIWMLRCTWTCFLPRANRLSEFPSLSHNTRANVPCIRRFPSGFKLSEMFFVVAASPCTARSGDMRVPEDIAHA